VVEDAPIAPMPPEPDPPTASPPPKAVSRAAFFAALSAAEASKPKVGTVHATGRKAESLGTEKSQDWECQKCHYRNFKECLACAKCRALHRTAGRNQASGYCQ